MTQEIINIGAQPNDGEGDPLRTAFQKINNNFTQLFSTDFSTSESYTVGTSTQLIFQAPVATFTQGVFQLNSMDTASANSQNITLTASITNNQAALKWNGHSTLFLGDPITRYDMDISGANIRILVTPIVDSTLYHFIASQITFTGTMLPGLDLALDGYPSDSLMSTENGLDLATET
jgi:hypothetical protein